jgi:hypothetical protein
MYPFNRSVVSSPRSLSPPPPWIPTPPHPLPVPLHLCELTGVVTGRMIWQSWQICILWRHLLGHVNSQRCQFGFQVQQGEEISLIMYAAESKTTGKDNLINLLFWFVSCILKILKNVKSCCSLSLGIPSVGPHTHPSSIYNDSKVKMHGFTKVAWVAGMLGYNQHTTVLSAYHLSFLDNTTRSTTGNVIACKNMAVVTLLSTTISYSFCFH